jgi:hypothetical protein
MPSGKACETPREVRSAANGPWPTDGAKGARITFLHRKRLVTIADAQLKLDGEDWHGVADAAMDLRDIDSELDGLTYDGGESLLRDRR